MNGDEFGTILEGSFNLNVVDHLGNALHHLVAGDDVGASLHEVGDGAAVTGAFETADACPAATQDELATIVPA